MKKIVAAVLTLAIAGTVVFAQTTNNGSTSLTDPDPKGIGNDSALQSLREVSVDQFEREGAWKTHISYDYGVISDRMIAGKPAGKEELKDSKNNETTDEYVLGVKAEFFKRGVNSFYITAERPIPIEGVTKIVSVWACGRNMNHDLYLILEDYNNNRFELWMGDLEFSGWKKITCTIPPSEDNKHGIVQTSVYHGDKPGLKIVGFRVDCDPEEAIGTYYLYLDDLRAVTDMYDIDNKNPDDMTDNW